MIVVIVTVIVRVTYFSKNNQLDTSTSAWCVQGSFSQSCDVFLYKSLPRHLCFCHGPRRRLKAMAMRPPCWKVVTSNWTNENRHVCKAWNWSRVVDCLMIVSWLYHDCLMTVSWMSHDCVMTQTEIIRIRWAMGQCRVGPCFKVKQKQCCVG